ncbi:DUF2397 family protein, partial [Frankia sp. AgB1.9]|uniref:DUF2397 family protein n=1 Tax=Frankia sp. AgB1.9 TaxID=1836968 RepID=UPI001931FE81
MVDQDEPGGRVAGGPGAQNPSSEPAPFAHLSAPNATLYRDVLTAFVRARDRFIVHLRPEDVSADVQGAVSAESMPGVLDQLAEWGNLRGGGGGGGGGARGAPGGGAPGAGVGNLVDRPGELEPLLPGQGLAQ